MRKLVQETRERDYPFLLSVVNWGEVYSYMWRGWGRAIAESRLLEIAQLPIQVIDADKATAKLAATSR